MVCFLSINLVKIKAQRLIEYSDQNFSAKVLYNKALKRIFATEYVNDPTYPIRGAYSPTAFHIKGVKNGVGVCNYIYLPTEEKLLPGEEYSIKIKIQLSEELTLMPFFKEHFGMALSTDLYEDEYGLWPKHFISFSNFFNSKDLEIQLNFRPLCKSKYLVIGVFQNNKKDEQACFFCPHTFELINLEVIESQNLEEEFHYLCDGFYEDSIERKELYSIDTDTIYFPLGSLDIDSSYLKILDGIPTKLRTSQDLIGLYSYTDKIGNDNLNLSMLRNLKVKDELIKRGIDSSRFILTNYGEKRSRSNISQSERRVEIDINNGKLFQKYYTEALLAARVGDFREANKLIGKWLSRVPRNFLIYSLFDNWGKEEKSSHFLLDLSRKVKSREYYRKSKLKFQLDSLHCLYYLPQGINIAANHLPTFEDYSDYNHVSRDINYKHEIYALKLFDKYSFPTKEEVGTRANRIIPEIITQSENIELLKDMLPQFREACEKEIIEWYHYAKLYDKILIYDTGFQKYGTYRIINDALNTQFKAPVLDVEMLNEHRKQVKLAPFTSDQIQKTLTSQMFLNKNLIESINDIFNKDQYVRKELKAIEINSTKNQEESQLRIKRIETIDSLNIQMLIPIIDTLSQNDRRVLGYNGYKTIFLVIQHADLATQERYFQYISKLADKGFVSKADLAYIIDRIAVQKGKPQTYGTQVLKNDLDGTYFLAPISNPMEVEKRRKEVGLGSLKDYLKKWNLDY